MRFITCVLLLIANPLAAQEIQDILEIGKFFEGPVVVVDANTIELDAVRFRLHGINVIERDSPLGKESADALRRIIGDDAITCQVLNWDQQDRFVGRCIVIRELADLSAQMISRGWAMNADHSSDRYQLLEDQARYARRGLWRALDAE